MLLQRVDNQPYMDNASIDHYGHLERLQGRVLKDTAVLFLPNHPHHVNQCHLTVASTSVFAQEVQLPTTMANYDMNLNPIKLLYFR